MTTELEHGISKLCAVCFVFLPPLLIVLLLRLLLLQFNQYWQLYSNHRLANGTGDRGFWLVLPNRQEAPIWTSMKVGGMAVAVWVCTCVHGIVYSRVLRVCEQS